jgi:hypothetical protein
MKFGSQKLLLMGSKAFRGKRLPTQVARKLDEAIGRKMKIVVGEVPGACKLFQDYLQSKKYKDVTVAHAKSIRYNAGGWKTKQYGNSVPEREHNMIKECDSAIIIWQDSSGVIAENLERLKRAGKPTFVYEYDSKTGKATGDWLDEKRLYDKYWYWKEKLKKARNKSRRR